MSNLEFWVRVRLHDFWTYWDWLYESNGGGGRWKPIPDMEEVIR